MVQELLPGLHSVATAKTNSTEMRKKAHRYTKDDYVFVYQMLVLRTRGWSYPRIGKMFNKDHSTVIHWCRRFDVDVGKPLLSEEDFTWRINKKIPPNRYKYREVFDEPINRGKLTYAQYLAADKLRKEQLTRAKAEG